MGNILTLPGLIDPHVHLRDPGQTEKEDFTSGSKAALAGGFTTILDMPNNTNPVFSENVLDEKIKIAKDKIICDVGFYLGSLGDNLDEFEKAQNKVFGLKLYLNKTTGNFLIKQSKLEQVFASWTDTKPILLHAIDDTIEEVISTLKKHPRPIHIVHVSSEYELSKIIEAKERNLPITCGVTPHHLFLSENDEKDLGTIGKMQPPLRKQSDVDFLWKNLGAIDCIESDHAPHTIDEKRGVARAEGFLETRRSLKLASLRSSISGTDKGVRLLDRRKKEPGTGPRENTPFGIPGLETTLPLLLTAVSENKLTMDDIVRLCHKGPKQVFFKHYDDTYHHSEVFIDPHTKYEIKNEDLFTKSKWTPFDGWKVKGKVTKVTLRGTTVFDNGKILTNPGSGKILTP